MLHFTWYGTKDLLLTLGITFGIGILLTIAITFSAKFVLDAKLQNRDSLEISLIFSNHLRSYFLRQFVKQLVYWPFGDNNLCPFHLRWTEIVLKCEREYKYVFHNCRYSMITENQRYFKPFSKNSCIQTHKVHFTSRSALVFDREN